MSVKSWKEIVEILMNNPDDNQLCPECKETQLTIKDVLHDPDSPGFGGVRFIGCSKCNLYEVEVIRSRNQAV